MTIPSAPPPTTHPDRSPGGDGLAEILALVEELPVWSATAELKAIASTLREEARRSERGVTSPAMVDTLRRLRDRVEKLIERDPLNRLWRAMASIEGGTEDPTTR